MTFPALFEPLTLPESGRRLKNRLVMAPMPTFAAQPNGAVSDAEVAYYRRRAAGGLAAVITAGCAVAADGVSFAGQWRCDRDELDGSLARTAEAIRSGGALAVAQLCHHGVARVEEADVPGLVASFAEGARRARRAGFDAVEIHGGHRYLVQQFFSPRTNPGKTFDRRAEFPLALSEAVVEAWGGAIWMRLDPEEPAREDYGFDELCELAQALAEKGVEVFDVSAKDYFAGSLREAEDRRPRAKLLQQRLDRPTLAVGGIATPEQALAARMDGCALVGLGRVLLGEPEWPRRVWTGEAAEFGDPLDSDARLKSADVPEPVIAYLKRKPAERRIG